jgi:hypothetical protein
VVKSAAGPTARKHCSHSPRQLLDAFRVDAVGGHQCLIDRIGERLGHAAPASTEAPSPSAEWEKELGTSQRGCAFANAAVELPDANHPARRVIEEYKSRHRDLIVDLCRQAGLRDPELLADQLFLLGEGARVTLQSLGRCGPAERLAEMFQRLVAAHAPSGS